MIKKINWKKKEKKKEKNKTKQCQQIIAWVKGIR